MKRNLIRASIVLGGTAGGTIITFIVTAFASAKTGTFYHG